MGHDDTRGKAASDRPKTPEEGTDPTDPVPELTDLHSAFDSIDDNMKDVARREVMVTPETLEQIVNDAVAKALTAYEQARGATPEASAASQGGAAAPNQARAIAPRQPTDPAAALSLRRARLEQLQGDMGLDEIEFESAPAEPVETVDDGTLSAQMGVNDFEFDDIPGTAAEPAAVPLDIEAVADWMATTAAPDVGQVRAAAASKPKTGEAEQELDWVAAEIAELDAAQARMAAEQPAVPTDPEPPPYQAPEAVAPAIEKPSAAVIAPAIEEPPAAVIAPAIEEPRAAGIAPAIEEPRAAVKTEARDTRGGLASWFRSARGDSSPPREPATAVPVPEPAAPPMPAASAALQPEPEVEAPAPVAAKPEEKPRPTRDPAAALKPPSPEEAAETTRFTFDPILPVPPRLPREPNAPPKKINKSGTFL